MIRSLPNKLLTVLMALTVLLAGCRRAAPGAEAAPPSEPLRFAVLPILDTLPLYVAEAEGYFADAGVAVTLVPVASAAERDQLLQAGQIDGVITDLVALALANRAGAGSGMIAVRYAMVPTDAAAQFRILAAGGSGLTTPGDLAGVPIGVSEGTVIEYVTTRVLEAEGIPAGEIATLAVPQIPERMALLNAGELQAATLPEPLASLAVQQGATVVADDRPHADVSASIYAFRAEVVGTRPADVDRFLTAIDRASDAVNADKPRWAGLLTDKQLVPPPIADTYTLPDYPAAGLPTEAQYADVAAWLRATGRLEQAPAYADVVRQE